jgi:hypothetical protein
LGVLLLDEGSSLRPSVSAPARSSNRVISRARPFAPSRVGRRAGAQPVGAAPRRMRERPQSCFSTEAALSRAPIASRGTVATFGTATPPIRRKH